MGSIFGLLATPLGWLMRLIYNFLGSYGWALIVFVTLTRLITLPLSIKQQKSGARTAAIQPKLQQLQKQYANNKEKYNEEMMKLYEKEGINPMGGCLPMLIQMVLLFGIIDVIYSPLKHLLAIPNDVLTQAKELLGKAQSAPELSIISRIQTGSTEFANVFSAEQIDSIKNFNMHFLGFDMGAIPKEVMGWLILIPIFAFLSQIASTFVTTKMQAQGGASMGGMKWSLYAMSLLSLYIAFTLPAGVGFYWTISSVLMAIQSYALGKLYPPEKVLAMTEKESEKNRAKMKKKREQMEMYTKMRESGASPTKAAVYANTKAVDGDGNENAQKRLAEARRKLAEKYGDEYKD